MVIVENLVFFFLSQQHGSKNLEEQSRSAEIILHDLEQHIELCTEKYHVLAVCDYILREKMKENKLELLQADAACLRKKHL
jgi:hypothetical protein